MTRYTVVYEGDPTGAKILSGEPAPGEAITVGLGDLYAENAAFRQVVEDFRSGAREADRQIASLLGEVRRLTGPSDNMRHTKAHTYYTVLARGAQMQCAFPVSDYDRVTVYRGADGTLWVRPDAEFWDGKRFVPSDTPFVVDPYDLSSAVEG